MKYLKNNIYVEQLENGDEEEDVLSVPADPTIKNYTYGIVDDVLYYRENAMMYRPAINANIEERIKKLCEIKKILRELIDLQLNDCSEIQLQEAQVVLNQVYDEFVKSYGIISSDINKRAFQKDVDGPLLYSLEEEKEKQIVKAKIFTQRTIHPNIQKQSAENAMEAYHISLNELGYVNIPRMLELYPVNFETLKNELVGQIYLNPERAEETNPYQGYESAEEYLSGNVRKKLRIAKEYAKKDNKYLENVTALEQVQPKELEASDIRVKLGTPWIEVKDYEKFLYELVEIPRRLQRDYPWTRTPIVINFESHSKPPCPHTWHHHK